MGKQKGPPGVQNRAIYSRACYLYQAANYLLAECANQSNLPSTQDESSKEHSAAKTAAEKQSAAIGKTSRLALSDMRAVSLKAQIRQTPEMKRSICKFCDSLLVEGQTSQSTVENLSKGARKPWADVLVIQCNTCGYKRRYPVSAPRQLRREIRPDTTDKREQADPAANEKVSS